ncbi:MAG: DNA topoisomerase I, partial [Flavobacteriia bacterium]|nr:DNA topoisomerase I [Flavobacteriia bacterium]
PPDRIDRYLSADQKKLYRLIWNRFVASQMTACELESTQILVKTDTDYYLKANGSRIVFDGFKKIYEEKTEEDTNSDNQQLPKLSEHQDLALNTVLATQKFTQPPPRYTEASLIKTLEQEGIGRPSTYAPTMSTIQDRGYVDKNGRQLISTELGQIVNTKLGEFFDDILNVKFTANLENQLDEIMSGGHDWHAVVRSFYDPFSKQISIADAQMEKVNRDKPTDLDCENCGSPMVIKTGRYGEFTACSNYPECKTILKTPKTVISTGIHCPECTKNNLENPIVERKTRRGKIFFGCSGYPKCTFALWDRPIQHACTECDSTIILEKVKKDTKTWQCMRCNT